MADKEATEARPEHEAVTQHTTGEIPSFRSVLFHIRACRDQLASNPNSSPNKFKAIDYLEIAGGFLEKAIKEAL